MDVERDRLKVDWQVRERDFRHRRVEGLRTSCFFSKLLYLSGPEITARPADSLVRQRPRNSAIIASRLSMEWPVYFLLKPSVKGDCDNMHNVTMLPLLIR